MTTTDLMYYSLIGRAHTWMSDAAPASTVALAHAQIPATATTSYRATTTNPWLGGFGFGGGTCSTTAVVESTKRIQPGRLEGVT